jgi:hypothetical protein
MIQRILLRQFRAAAARPAPTPFLAGSLIKSSQRFAQNPRSAIAARCYATNGEAKKAGEEEAGKSDAAATEDAIAKEIEAKNKEIVDLKVCRC